MPHLTITVKGKQHRWVFKIDADPRHIEEWRADGLEIDEVFYTAPAWAVNAGLLKVWIWATDLKRLVWR